MDETWCIDFHDEKRLLGLLAIHFQYAPCNHPKYGLIMLECPLKRGLFFRPMEIVSFIVICIYIIDRILESGIRHISLGLTLIFVHDKISLTTTSFYVLSSRLFLKCIGSSHISFLSTWSHSFPLVLIQFPIFYYEPYFMKHLTWLTL